MGSAANDINQNNQDSPSNTVVFIPQRDITFPNSCVGCLASSPKQHLQLNIIVVETLKESKSGGTVGAVIGGALGGILGAAVGGEIG